MPSLSFLEIIGVMAFGVLCVVVIASVVLAAVAFGAFLVFKSRNEDGNLFNIADRSGDAAIVSSEPEDDVDLPLGEDVSQRGVNAALDRVLAQNRRFAQQRDAETKE